MTLVSSTLPTVDTPHLPSNSTLNDFFKECQESVGSVVIYTVYTFLDLVLFPLYVFILVVGFQRWRHQRSGPAGATTSHSDFFTYQMMFVEVFGVLGSVFYTVGSFIKSDTITFLGIYLFNIIFPGQSLFHVLTCAERYLAVVHAITYVHTRERVKLRVRNISTVSVWLLCFGWIGVLKFYLPYFPSTLILPCITFCLVLTCFCCLSVLRFLNRPRPGDNLRVDPTKKKAFNMILAITAALLLRVLGLFVCLFIAELSLLDQKHICVVMDSGIWLTLPSSLVLPLLFLHRAGKLPRC